MRIIAGIIGLMIAVPADGSGLLMIIIIAGTCGSVIARASREVDADGCSFSFTRCGGAGFITKGV